ncbi:MAG: GNAT family N-acetyltransferase [Bacteroidales bacterium]
MKITIHKADSSALASITHFQLEMASETEELLLDHAVVKEGVRFIFEHPSHGFYLLASEGTTVVGCLLVLYEWSDWRNGHVLWLHSVYVLPEYRQNGIFKSMYQYVKNMVSRDNSMKGIRLYVEKENKLAQKVYQDIGMTDEHYTLFEWLKENS